jgi:hypothetical protein
VVVVVVLLKLVDNVFDEDELKNFLLKLIPLKKTVGALGIYIKLDYFYAILVNEYDVIINVYVPPVKMVEKLTNI